MKRLIQGVHQFQKGVFPRKQELYRKLSKLQEPQTLFITCSDSRVIPNLITQSDPGELFVIRNAGNLVPPYSETTHGESASLEYAVRALNVQDIVVCGHSGCGAMQGLLEPERIRSMPHVARWIDMAAATTEIMATRYAELPPEDRLNVAIQENVLVQLENLRTYPFVQEGIESGRIHVYGWVYKIPTGDVFQYDYDHEQFVPLARAEQARAATK